MFRWTEEMARAPVALVPDKANEQHYELPPQFFRLVLGRHLKYSSGYWPAGVETLDDSEAAMLALTCERAGLEDGQEVLELGCGWGSLSLWMAERYPRSRILAVSNSAPQREHIASRAAERGLTNLEVVTRDMNSFDTGRRFDRVVSVEMLEHMRNWAELTRRIRGWLRDDGRLFVHVFSHRELAYPFEAEGDSNWMGRHFFTGGMMPSHDQIGRVARGLEVEEDWLLDGRHYGRTSEAWLRRLDANRDRVWLVLADTYGEDQAETWLQRWRVFFMACAELFAFRRGTEWGVSHYLLKPTEDGA
jgi:cyclopropane-fatty-acyl-phospholipid synthase